MLDGDRVAACMPSGPKQHVLLWGLSLCPRRERCARRRARCVFDVFGCGHVFSIVHTTIKPPWPNGQGVGLLIRRLRVRVPQEVCACALLHNDFVVVVAVVVVVVAAVEEGK